MINHIKNSTSKKMIDIGTSTEDLCGIMPKLVSELSKQDDQISNLKNELYKSKHEYKFKKVLKSFE